MPKVDNKEGLQDMHHGLSVKIGNEEIKDPNEEGKICC
jgi:hypothetical protein